MKIEEVCNLLNNYASKCKESGQFETSRIALKRALTLQPDRPVLHSNYGAVLWNMHDYVGAEEQFKIALDLIKENPLQESDIHASPHANYGLLLLGMKKWKESEEQFNLSIENEFKRVTAKWDMACMLLDSGDWERGFKAYDVRKVYLGDKYYPKLPYEIWDGEADLNGKTLYVQGEQGVGDRILSSRYLIWLKEKYPDCHIIYFSEAANMSLFWEYRDYVELMPFGVPWPKADYGVFQMDLLGIYGSRPDNVPPDPGLILKRCEPYRNFVHLPPPNTPSLKVGICWTGNPEQNLNTFRSIPLELLLQLAENPHVTLYSVQVGPGQQDIKRLDADDLVCDMGDDLKEKGFSGTGQVLLNLDLVITCCTSIAHLAGALKVPCMTLLCYAPYWVWLNGRDDTFWYPKTMKLYRQPAPGDWQSVINQVKIELNQIVEQRMPILTKAFDK